MSSSGGPWTVIQKRFDGSVDFYRGWADYTRGFGRADGEYWLGLRNIHLLTQKKSYRLRIDLEDFEGDRRFVTYSDFAISPLAIFPEQDGYRLSIDGFKEGDPSKPVGNCLSGVSGTPFSTYDNDRDSSSANCAAIYKGAFWYTSCHNANLNGQYLQGATDNYATGLVWNTWKGYKYSLKRSEMKIASSTVGQSKVTN
ncbi:microfibril-associated glycoprotein 4-like [Gastrophryne carolinensis]